jgi:hypothetical protein
VLFVRRAAVEGPEFSRLCTGRALTSQWSTAFPLLLATANGSCEIKSGSPTPWAAHPLTAVPPARSLADDESHATEASQIGTITLSLGMRASHGGLRTRYVSEQRQTGTLRLHPQSPRRSLLLSSVFRSEHTRRTSC